jgi:hypothetical protein
MGKERQNTDTFVDSTHKRRAQAGLVIGVITCREESAKMLADTLRRVTEENAKQVWD